MKEILYPFKQKRTLLQMGLCALIFIGMAIPFKSMVLIEGFTEVRPVNAVPVVVGLLFGPIGAWGCAFGNLIADLFGTFSKSSILGFIGNFIAAYMPYKLWHFLRKGETPNVKNFANIGIYIFISLISALATGIFISCGLDVFFGFWSQKILKIICFNDFLFPVLLGLPALIVLTCDDNNVKAFMPHGEVKYPILRNICFVLNAISIIVILVMIFFGFTVSGSLLLLISWILFLLSLIGIII